MSPLCEYTYFKKTAAKMVVRLMNQAVRDGRTSRAMATPGKEDTLSRPILETPRLVK